MLVQLIINANLEHCTKPLHWVFSSKKLVERQSLQARAHFLISRLKDMMIDFLSQSEVLVKSISWLISSDLFVDSIISLIFNL